MKCTTNEIFSSMRYIGCLTIQEQKKLTNKIWYDEEELNRILDEIREWLIKTRTFAPKTTDEWNLVINQFVILVHNAKKDRRS